jgi:gluconolactonase
MSRSFQRRDFLLTGIGFLGCHWSLQAALRSAESVGEIVRQDPRLDQLVPKDAHIEKLADGFDWAEGPVWEKAKNRLLFSDIPKNMIWQWSKGSGLQPFLKPSGYTGSTPRTGESGSNALTFNADGKLVLCQHGDRRIALLNDDGKTFTTLADKYQGKRFNSPNDLVFKKNGDLYFTDPPYGLEKGADDPARELDFCGVYRLSKSGKLTLLTKDLTRPNGLAFSPDEKTLYLANSDPKQAVWMAYAVKDNGTLGTGKLFHDCTKEVGKKKGLPDGMKVDEQGHVFATGVGGVWAFTPHGDLLGRIDPGCATANCGWGEDGSTLFMTADKMICSIRLSTRGPGF